MNRNNNAVESSKGHFVGAHRIRVLAIALASCGPIGLAPQLVRSEVVVVDVVAVAQGQRTSDLKGKPVLNEKSERVGTVRSGAGLAVV